VADQDPRASHSQVAKETSEGCHVSSVFTDPKDLTLSREERGHSSNRVSLARLDPCREQGHSSACVILPYEKSKFLEVPF